jgi:hAT family C-terminal dimerisation region
VTNDVPGPICFEAAIQGFYATIPATTSVVERSFSKLKIVKSRLRSLCKQERLSELLMLSIEKDIPVDESEVINHFKRMTDRRLLLGDCEY